MATENLPVSWADKLAKYSAAQANTERASADAASTLKVKGLKFWQGDQQLGDSFTCVILDSIHINEYYDRAFDPDNPASPICYAFGRGKEGEVMAPHADAEAPQCETCKGCPQDKFPPREGSKQPPKPCKNVRRVALLAVTPQNFTADAIDAAEMAFLKISVTNVTKRWAPFYNSLTSQGFPTWAHVCKISVEYNEKTQYQLKFEVLGRLDPSKGDLLDALEARYNEAQQAITFAFRPNGTSTEEAAAAREATRSRVK